MSTALQDTSEVKIGLAVLGRSIKHQLKTLSSELDGVCNNGETENVHRSRVASRKLRVALAMLRGSGDGRHLSRWKRRLRRITRELGEARDLDVIIERLTAILAGGIEKPAALGVALVLAEFESERCRLQPRLAAAVRSYEKSGVQREMMRAVKRAQAKKQPLAAGELERFRVLIGARIAKQGRRFLADAKFLDAPGSKNHYHAMRISAKHLRYSLEMARNFYAVDWTRPIEAAKRVQSLLGEIHDCDLWLERLDEFATSESVREETGRAAPGRTARLTAGMDWLKQQFKTGRDEAFNEFLTSWDQWQVEGFWSNMLTTLGTAPSDQIASRNAASGDTASGNPTMCPADGDFDAAQ